MHNFTRITAKVTLTIGTHRYPGQSEHHRAGSVDSVRWLSRPRYTIIIIIYFTKYLVCTVDDMHHTTQVKPIRRLVVY